METILYKWDYKGTDVKLMVWTCFLGRKKGPLLFIMVELFDRWVNIAILRPDHLPTHQKLHDTIGKPMFMEDNPKVHTADVGMEFWGDHNVQVMEWPPYSSDLNPIEHYWRRLKEMMHERYPGILKIPGCSRTMERRLAEVLPEI